MSAFVNLSATKLRADLDAIFESFIASQRAAGWSDADIAEYRKVILVMIEILALYPANTYEIEERARQGARGCLAHLDF